MVRSGPRVDLPVGAAAARHVPVAVPRAIDRGRRCQLESAGDRRRRVVAPVHRDVPALRPDPPRRQPDLRLGVRPAGRPHARSAAGLAADPSQRPAANIITAAWHHPEPFQAIGASTAVFGALGLVTGAGILQHHSTASASYHCSIPLAGGLALFGWLGLGGPGIDMLGHAAGFACGVVLGMLAAGLPRLTRRSQRPVAQDALGLLRVTALVAHHVLELDDQALVAEFVGFLAPAWCSRPPPASRRSAPPRASRGWSRRPAPASAWSSARRPWRRSCWPGTGHVPAHRPPRRGRTGTVADETARSPWRRR